MPLNKETNQSTYIYIDIYMCVCMHIYVYIHIYIETREILNAYGSTCRILYPSMDNLLGRLGSLALV